MDARLSEGRLDSALIEARENIAAANARVVERDRDVVEARDSAAVYRAQRDSALSAMDSVIARGPRIVTRYHTVRDTASRETLVPIVDSLVAHIGDVEVALANSVRAFTAEVQRLEKVVAMQEKAIAARDEKIDALDTYTRELESRLRGGDPIWPTLVLVAGGGVLGYAVDGPQGAFVGVGAGLGVDVVRRGVKSLVRSIP